MEIKIAKTKLIDTPQILIVNKSNKCLNVLSKDLQKQINVLCKKLNYVADFGKFLKINLNNEIFILAGLGDNENNAKRVNELIFINIESLKVLIK